MTRLCLPWLSRLCLLAAVALSGCTGGNKNGYNSAPAAPQVDPKPFDTNTAASAASHGNHLAKVEIKGMKFSPEVLTIHKGDTVLWVNNDLTNHCVTEAANKWTSSAIASGASWKKVVTESADYFCAIHVVMKGRIKAE